MTINSELINHYKDKHNLEPVLFSSIDDNGIKSDIKGIVTPIKIDLRQFCSPTDNQGDTPHCAAYSVAQILESIYWKETGKLLQLDASHIYAKSKEIDGIKDSNGTYPEITLKVALELSKNIIPHKYNIKIIRNDHSNNFILRLKRIIHKNGILAGGFKITDDWYSLHKYNSFLKTESNNSLGGHCVLIVGYLNDSIIIQNSWGKEWGANGFARIDWDIVLKEFIYGVYLERVD